MMIENITMYTPTEVMLRTEVSIIEGLVVTVAAAYECCLLSDLTVAAAYKYCLLSELAVAMFLVNLFLTISKIRRTAVNTIWGKYRINTNSTNVM
jgi:hypothetical protein